MAEEDPDLENLVRNLHRSSIHEVNLSSSALNSATDSWRFSIYVKILVTDRSIRFSTIKSTLTSMWARYGIKSITQVTSAIFLADFHTTSAIDYLIADGPWLIQNDFLILEKLKPGKTIGDYGFDKISLWIQIHDLPIDFLSPTIIQDLIAGYGRILPIDPLVAEQWKSFARVKVEFPVDFKLKTAVKLTLQNGEALVANLRYERLKKFCNICCVLGHEAVTCKIRTRILAAAETCSSDSLKSYLIQSIQPKLSHHIQATNIYQSDVSSFFPPTRQAAKGKEVFGSHNHHDTTSVKESFQLLDFTSMTGATKLQDEEWANKERNLNVSREVCISPLLSKSSLSTSDDLTAPVQLDASYADATITTCWRSKTDQKVSELLRKAANDAVLSTDASNSVADNRLNAIVSQQVCWLTPNQLPNNSMDTASASNHIFHTGVKPVRISSTPTTKAQKVDRKRYANKLIKIQEQETHHKADAVPDNYFKAASSTDTTDPCLSKLPVDNFSADDMIIDPVQGSTVPHSIKLSNLGANNRSNIVVSPQVHYLHNFIPKQPSTLLSCSTASNTESTISDTARNITISNTNSGRRLLQSVQDALSDKDAVDSNSVFNLLFKDADSTLDIAEPDSAHCLKRQKSSSSSYSPSYPNATDRPATEQVVTGLDQLPLKR